MTLSVCSGDFDSSDVGIRASDLMIFSGRAVSNTARLHVLECKRHLLLEGGTPCPPGATCMGPQNQSKTLELKVLNDLPTSELLSA